MIIGAGIVCLLLVALAMAFAMIFCMFLLMFAEIAGTVLQSAAKKKDRHAP